jgi:hypothetical protein
MNAGTGPNRKLVLTILSANGCTHTTQPPTCRLGTATGVPRQDAWFWNFNPKRGCVFMVRASIAYGPHNSNAHVMYIGSQITGAGVIGGIPTAAWKAAHRRVRQQAEPAHRI